MAWAVLWERNARVSCQGQTVLTNSISYDQDGLSGVPFLCCYRYLNIPRQKRICSTRVEWIPVVAAIDLPAFPPGATSPKDLGTQK